MCIQRPGSGKVAVRRYTNEQIQRYFTKERYPLASISTICILGALALVFAIFSIWSITLICAGLCTTVSVVVYLRARSIPTYEQYDEWHKEIGQRLALQGQNKLNRELKQRIPLPESICSFVLPASRMSAHYSVNNVYMREKHGVYRFSFNTFTYFYFTEHYLAIRTYRVNVFDQPTVVAEEEKAYFYNHIVDFTSHTENDHARINGHNYVYRTTRFCLLAVNGKVNIGAYIDAKPIGDNRWQAPNIEMNVDEVVAELRRRVRTKWRLGR